MAIVNPSFEIAGTNPGEASGWDIAADSACTEVASFGAMLGYESFSAGWRLPIGRKLAESLAASETVWASVADNVFTAGSAPSANYVAGVVATLLTGSIPSSGDITVTLTYTNEDSVASRTATAVIPANTIPGTEYSFTLQSDDLGFESIQNLQTSSAIDSTINVLGSWLLIPLNDAAVFEFSASALELFTIGSDNYEDFEDGWVVEYGLIDDFDAIESESVGFAEKIFATYGDSFTYDNDSQRYIWYNDSLSGPVAADTLATVTLDEYPHTFAQVEGTSKNYIDYTEDFTQWSVASGATVTPNVVNSPKGDLTADRVTFIASATSRATLFLESVPVGAYDDIVLSIWVRTESGVKPFRVRLYKRDASYDSSNEFYADTTWQRFYFHGNLGTGGTTPRMVLQNAVGADAGSIVVWGAKADYIWNMYAPTSYTPGDGAQETRNADDLSMLTADVPDDVMLGPFGVDIIPSFSSNEYALDVANPLYIWHFYSAGREIECILGYDSGGAGREISIRGRIPEAIFVRNSIEVTWRREQRLRIWVNPISGDLILSGFDTGNGTYTGTQWGSTISSFSGNIVWGNNNAGDKPFYGLVSQPYRIDPDSVPVELFESYWNLPKSPLSITNEIDSYSFVPFIDSSVSSTATIAFVIAAGVNDRVSLRWLNEGTFKDLDVVISAGNYSVTTMVAELNTKIDAALDADFGGTTSSHFTASVGPNDNVRLTTSYAIGNRPMMELVDPVSDSAWGTLGFTASKLTYRITEGVITELASLDVANDNYEDFEEEWDDNEDSVFVFDLTPTPADLELGTFGSDNAESFETGGDDPWTLTL